MHKKTVFLFSTACLLNASALAQEAAQTDAGALSLKYIVWGLAAVVAFLLAVALLLAYGFSKFSQLHGATMQHAPQQEVIIFTHEYDGIRELDNSLPSWWKWMFYLSIVFSVIYMYYYHLGGQGALSIAEYQAEVTEAEAQKQAYLEKAANLVNETSVVALTESADLKNGEKTFSGLCVPCHGAMGEGKPSLGPNLTDEYWLHGGSIKSVFKTVKYGVQGKAMIAWQDQLSPRQMQEVSSYVLSLQGTNPPNAKEPEGEKYTPEGAAL